ncbi:MAG: hypothetical protein MUP66_01555 [Candidatus Nanohaloarchaeota archaeon QJJ-5]|nr:hypothetical protein [Candidatus Nanohaloarchaeota archaeon QJJ-5]
MPAIIDANIFIHASSRALPFETMMTVPAVTGELESFEAQQRFESHDITVREPEEATIEEIASTADTHNLSVSRADIALVALASETDGRLITDDYQLQNLAKQCDIDVEGFVRDEIEDAGSWTRQCPNCGQKRDAETCPVCNVETTRVSD